MAEHGTGTKHNALTGGTYVYTKEQCDTELDKKQDSLVPGRGIGLDGNKIYYTLENNVPNRMRVKNINDGSLTEGTVVSVDEDYHVYYATVTSASTGAFTFKNLARLAGTDAYTIELWVNVSDPTFRINFSDENIVYVGDTDYSVNSPNQTMYFTVRYFLGKIYVNKYYVN